MTKRYSSQQTVVPTPYAKINSKWIIDINVRVKGIKHLIENTREDLHDLWLDKELLDRISKTQAIKEN